MKERRLIVSIILVLSLVSLSHAQRQTGSIFGRVTDKEGSPLPGATVSISGPAMMGTSSYVTSEVGIFRFPSLLPGEYEIKVEMPGFKTLVQKGIIVSVGKTTEANLELEVAKVEEEVTVVAASPVVDTQSTKLSINYGVQFLTSIPMNRDLYDIQNSIPGAIADGADYRRTSSILGGTVRSQLYALDGVPMNDPATWYSMVNINVDVYEEIEFQVASLPAEVGQADSTYVNIVTKSGGNKFSGGGTIYYTGESLAQDLLSKEQVKALNVNPPEKYTDSRDASINLGGPLVKDRLWFFINGRRLTWDQAYPGTPETRMWKLGFTNSPHYDLRHEEWMGFIKLTFQVAKNLRYMGMLHYNHIYEPVYSNSVGVDTSFEATEIWDHENTYTTTHQFNWVLNQNTFLDIRGSYVWRYFPLISRNPGEPTYYDNVQKVYWGTSPYNDIYHRIKIPITASLTHFRDDFLGASHEIKAGAEFEQTEYHRDWYRANPYYSYWANYAAGNPYYYSTSGARGRLRIRTCPAERDQWDVQDHTRRFSAYIQDSIVAKRLAINLGLRFDYSYQYEPEQKRPQLRYKYGPVELNPAITDPNALLEALRAQWYADPTLPPYFPFDELTTPWKKVVEFKTFSPRVGLIYDLLGDGKTAFKVSFSRYYEPVWSAKYNAAQIFGASSINYYWYDLNKNKLMDLPPLDRYTLTSYPNQDPNYNYYVKDLKCPYMNEVVTALEREVYKDFKLGLQFLWRENKNIVEDTDLINGYDANAKDEKGLIWLPFTFTDPGWDGKWGTSDDQQLTVYGLRADRPVPTWKGMNPPEAKRKYWAVILTFDKRMSGRWQLNGSILYSSFKGNASPTYGATEGESSMFDNPNALINAYGSTDFDRPLQIRIMGTYILPYDFILSAYLQFRSGSPWNRTIARVYFPASFASLVQQAYVSINAETPGSRRNPPYTNLDLRLEKSFKFGNYGKFGVYIDIFNLAGRNGVNVNQNPAPYLRFDKTPPTYEVSTVYGLITSCYGVRSFRLGVRYSF